MTMILLVMTSLIGQMTFAALTPIPREQLQNGNDPVEKTRMEADFCVTDKLECKQWQERKGASSYVTIPDADECAATDDQDTQTVACYLKD